MDLFIVSKNGRVYLTDKVVLPGEEILQVIEVNFPLNRSDLTQIVGFFDEALANFELRNPLKKENYDKFLQLSERERNSIRLTISMHLSEFDNLVTEVKNTLKDYYGRDIILADLLTMSEDEVFKIRNMGKERIRKLNDFLKKKKLTYDMPVFNIMLEC